MVEMLNTGLLYTMNFKHLPAIAGLLWARSVLLGSLKLLRPSSMQLRQQTLQPARQLKWRRPRSNLELQVGGLTKQGIDHTYDAEQLCKYGWRICVAQGMQV